MFYVLICLDGEDQAVYLHYCTVVSLWIDNALSSLSDLAHYILSLGISTEFFFCSELNPFYIIKNKSNEK